MLVQNLLNLNDAKLVKIYTGEGGTRVYAWFGTKGYEIYDENLNNIDFISMAGLENPSEAKVRKSIENKEDEIFNEENFTDDIFYSYEFDTGEDLERKVK